MLSEEEKNKLSEDGKKEVIELNIGGYNAVILVTFAYIRKGIAALIDTQVTGKGDNAKVSVNMDTIGAGDLLLFQCWHSGDEEIKKKMKLRLKACKILGEWIQQFADDEEEEEEKKS